MFQNVYVMADAPENENDLIVNGCSWISVFLKWK